MTAPGTHISNGASSSDGAAGPVIHYYDNDNKLILAYYDTAGLSDNIIYKESANDGQIWSSAMKISNTTDDSLQVTLTSIGKSVYAAWVEQSADASSKKLAFAANNNWPAAAPTIVSSKNGVVHSLRAPEIVTDGTNIHLVWSESDSSFDIKVFYALSTDSGQNWSAPVQVINSGTEALEVAITADQSGKLHVVWERQRFGLDTDVYYAQGTIHNGPPVTVTWDGGFKISSGVDNAKQPNVVFDGDKVKVSFNRFNSANEQDIYLAECAANCATQSSWSAPMNLLDQFVGVNGSRPFNLVADIVYDADMNTTFIYYHGTDINTAHDNEYIWGINSCDAWTTVDQATGTAPAQTRAIEPSIDIGNNYIHLAMLKVISSNENQVYYMRGELDMWDPAGAGDSFKACPRRILLPVLFRD
ncbi:MAG: exo-alpha-sialidase [Chloroflexi bacterium]|nr:exo-alpha-sialidase [Chloroflexota bacterium]